MEDKAIRYAKRHYLDGVDRSDKIKELTTETLTDYENTLISFANFVRDNIDLEYINSKGTMKCTRRYKDHKKHTKDFLEISWKSDWITGEDLPIFKPIEDLSTVNFRRMFAKMLLCGVLACNDNGNNGEPSTTYLAYKDTLFVMEVKIEGDSPSEFKITYTHWYR